MAVELFLEDFTPGRVFRSHASTCMDTDRIINFASEFDPQPFHLDPEQARDTMFGGLVASGWHTAGVTMRLLVESDFTPAGGIIGAGLEELRWPRVVNAGDTLRVEAEVMAARPSRSRPQLGLLKMQINTFNQRDELVQTSIANILVQVRPPSERSKRKKPPQAIP